MITLLRLISTLIIIRWAEGFIQSVLCDKRNEAGQSCKWLIVQMKCLIVVTSTALLCHHNWICTITFKCKRELDLIEFTDQKRLIRAQKKKEKKKCIALDITLRVTCTYSALHSYVPAESDLYLFWFISQRRLPKRAQQNRVITTVPLVSLIPQAIRICRTLFSTQKKLYRVVIDSESSAGTHGPNPLDHLIMFNKRQSLPLWFIALSKPVTNPGTAQIKAKSSSHWYTSTQIGPHTQIQTIAF